MEWSFFAHDSNVRGPDLISHDDKGKRTTHIVMRHKVHTRELFAHPVFSLDEAARKLAPRGGRSATVARLKHYVKTDRLKVVATRCGLFSPHGARASRRRPFNLASMHGVHRAASSASGSPRYHGPLPG